MTRRDVRAESFWLEQAEHHAGMSGFAEHATARLRAGEAAYGDRWASVGLPRLITELREEAADLGAWGVLALQALEDATGLENAQRELVAAALHAAILLGAYAYSGLSIAQAHFEGPR